MTRGTPHPAELRAQVVAAVLAGTSIARAAAQFKLSKQTVSRWAAEHPAGTVVGTVGTEKRNDLQDLIARYLEAGFHAMIAQAEVLGDHEYCRTQSANDLAIAHGVLGDKLAGVAATAQALGLIGTRAAAPAGDGATQPAGLGAPGPPESAQG